MRPRQTLGTQQITEQIIQKLPVSRSTTATFEKVGKYIKNNLRLKKNTNVLNLNGVFSAYNSFRENIRTNVFEGFIKQSDDQVKARIEEFGSMMRAGGLKLRENKDSYFESTAELVGLQKQIDQRVYVESHGFSEKVKLFLCDLQTNKGIFLQDEHEEPVVTQPPTQTQRDFISRVDLGTSRGIVAEEDDVDDEFEFSQIQIQSQKIKSKLIRGGVI